MKTVKRASYVAGALLFGSSAFSAAQPMIFQWIDGQGHTHYGDRPPRDTPVRRLDPGQLQLSTIGGTALRDGEQDLLSQYQAEAQRQREQAARQAAPPPTVVVVNPAPEPAAEKTVIWPGWWGPVQQTAHQKRRHPSWRFYLGINAGQNRRSHLPATPALPSSSIEPLPKQVKVSPQRAGAAILHGMPPRSRRLSVPR